MYSNPLYKSYLNMKSILHFLSFIGGKWHLDFQTLYFSHRFVSPLLGQDWDSQIILYVFYIEVHVAILGIYGKMLPIY